VTDCPISDGLPEVVTTVVVTIGVVLTVCLRAAEVLPRLLPFPEYTAVMEYVPAVPKNTCEHVATGPSIMKGAQSWVPPCMKMMFPGMTLPPYCEVTVAVKTTS